MSRLFNMPPLIVSGEDALQAAGPLFARMGKKALVVSDPVMRDLGNVDRLAAVLDGHALAYSVFTGITGEPDDAMIAAGLARYRREACDCLIALGGGSPIDAMKAIALLAKSGGKPADHLGKPVTERLAPMAAVPTTAGTGSEATQFTIVTDTASQVKMLLQGPALIPGIAVLDPVFTLTAPPAVTAGTGLDALCHCLEAYTSVKAQALSDTFALSAAKRIFRNLRTVYARPEDRAARAQMALAATEAGIAFNNSSVTLIHGMSRPIGALFHVPHGLSNALLMEVCLRHVADAALDRFGEIARACGFADPGQSDAAATGRLLDEIGTLCRDLKAPSLLEMGIDKAEFERRIPKMATDALASGSPANTRMKLTRGDIEDLYRRLG
ncbi:MAG: iron-containing alcohol dehydrogenase [Candidatus Accumulibacter sp.]|jgi:alcohol dehydrogenase class IV|nr:iron-containing alcohol dehydrogenase [Accumulibacter sp.]